MSKTNRTDERLTNERDLSNREVTENREYSEKDRLAMLRAANWQQKLPSIPDIPGYHVCWLTTNNTSDPVMGRLRLGYELIKASDIQGFSSLESLGDGPYKGCIMINEMVAAKIPLDLYAAYMRDVHHDQPLQEEQRLNAVMDTIRDTAERAKGRVFVEEGTAEMAAAKPLRPIFEGVGN